MDNTLPKDDLARQINQLDPSPSEQTNFLSKYSVAALVFGPIYYQFMNDRLFTVLCLISIFSVFLSPVVIILPFWARQRARVSRDWLNFRQYEATQKQWDRGAYWSAGLFIIASYFITRSMFSLIDRNLPFSKDEVNELKSAQTELKDLIR